jgi:phosphoribosylformylglycinamidine synthase subunit PurL
MGTPVTGGNVSLYNETLDSDGKPQPIYPTPVVGMVGLIPDLKQICGQGWQQEGDRIYLLGIPLNIATPLVTLGGSEYLASIHKTVAGRPPRVDFEIEKQVQAACRHGIQQGWARSAHDCAEGGMAIALAEACISGQKGANLLIPTLYPRQRWDELLFAEGGARIFVSVDPDRQGEWEDYLRQHLGIHWTFLGQVTPMEEGFSLKTEDNLVLINARIEEIASSWLMAIETRLLAD